MAKDTSITLRNQVIYSIYVRNHTSEGTFNALEADLERISSLGTDIIWFMPIHPIGVKNKKGDLGCPYAIKDYRAVNPEYGTLDDFKSLVNKIHNLGMKCIIDVVYNHTSPDSWLVDNNPEYFYRKSDGTMGNKVGDWWDIVDLDYNNKNLWYYQIETLKFWAEIVDGFRCDVAPLIPIDFWLNAREEVKSVNSDCLWLAETVHGNFIRELRKGGFVAHSDSETFEAFDICYDYDVQPYFSDYLKGQCSLKEYINMLNLQESIYPHNYSKLRFLENHDNPRAKHLIPTHNNLLNWTAFLYFQKGTTLLYGGQEVCNNKCPSLFDLDKINWQTNIDISPLMKKLYSIKKQPLISQGFYRLDSNENLQTVVGYYEGHDTKLVGIFNLKSLAGNVQVDVADGKYTNLLNGSPVEVRSGNVYCYGNPIIFNT